MADVHSRWVYMLLELPQITSLKALQPPQSHLPITPTHTHPNLQIFQPLIQMDILMLPHAHPQW